MKATQILPPNYQHYRTLDLSKNKALLIALNIAGLVLLIFFGWLFLRLAVILRPEPITINASRITLPGVLALILCYVGTLVLHELIHGLFFWITTHERPHFGVKQLYAFAAAPDWYLPRNPYLVVGLAPLVLITGIGIALIPFVPATGLIFLIFAMTINASGAVGDIYTVGWLLTHSSTVLVRDVGDAFSVYRPLNE